ncbi:ankyrin, partial [Schizophyllum commune Tattone D]
MTPLMISAFNGREDIVSVLLDRGAHIEDSNAAGWTALNFAAEKGYLGIARLLLERGAFVSARTKQQATPL